MNCEQWFHLLSTNAMRLNTFKWSDPFFTGKVQHCDTWPPNRPRRVQVTWACAIGLICILMRMPHQQFSDYGKSYAVFRHVARRFSALHSEKRDRSMSDRSRFHSFFYGWVERMRAPFRAGTGLLAVCPRSYSLTGAAGLIPHVRTSNEHRP